MGFFSRLLGINANNHATTNTKVNNETPLFDAAQSKKVLGEIDIDNAIAAHQNWKLRLNNYLAGLSQEDLRPEVVCLDNRCDLGKWLHGAGRSSLGHLPVYNVIISTHKGFHLQASSVVALHQAGQTKDAKNTLESGFTYTSNLVVTMLKELKRELQRT